MTSAEGPFFDDLQVGDVFDTAPGLTLTQGRAATHQAITGGRLRLSLDDELAERVTGGGPLADPALVWDVAIGQSTLATRRVVANLFYRGLAFHRMPAIGDTLYTRTEVVGLRQTTSGPRGLVALRITTTDQSRRTVLDFWRCAMLPLSSPDVSTGHADDLTAIGHPPELDALRSQLGAWQTSAHPASAAITGGQEWTLSAGDVVSSAPELARLTLNLAHVHHDEHAQQSGRLVYGGHTIGLATAHLVRAVPELVTIAGWHGCDHTGPVREGDTVRSSVHVQDVVRFNDDLDAVHFQVLVWARRTLAADEQVLDWRPIGLVRRAAPTASASGAS